MTPRPPKPALPKPRALEGKSIGVIGLGQIGGSIVRRLHDYRPAITLYGNDRNTRIAGRVRRYCRWSASLDDMVRAVDMIVLAVPVPDILELLPRIAGAVSRVEVHPPLVCDTGTLKHAVAKVAAKYARQFEFVGLHPFCGTEHNGWDSARSTLFEGQPIVCCAPRQKKGVKAASELVHLLGGRILFMDPAKHDRHIALTIGLPHILAFVANGVAAESRPAPELIGGSWESLTRVGVSAPEMVAGFLAANAAEQKRIVGEFKRLLDRLERLMAPGSDKQLIQALAQWRSSSG